jgi:hypothetical protein
VFPVEDAFVTLSMYAFMAVTVVPLGAVAAAEIVTGEFTVAPLAGAQILTVPATPDGEHCATAKSGANNEQQSASNTVGRTNPPRPG